MAPKPRVEVLEALDTAKTQVYHFKAIIIAGMGFYTDAYDLFVISCVTKLLGRLYYYDPVKNAPGILPSNVNLAVTGVALCGTLAGQLFFGWAGDKFGRKKVYGITLALMVITSLGQGLSLGHTPTSVITTLCFFRFFLGFGIGGDYPLSATIMSEYSNTKTRGAFVAAVFGMQGFGILSGGAVTIIISSIFKHYYPRESWSFYGNNPADPSTPHQADFVWRIVLMFGAIPAALTYYSRSKMPETARYTALVEKDLNRAALDMERVLSTHFDHELSDGVVVQPSKTKVANADFGLFSRKFARRHGTELLGTCACWFLLDISFYSQNLFQSYIYTAVGWLPPSKKMSALEETYKVSRAQALIALCSTVPGYWFTVAFVDWWGRKVIQLMGFFMMFGFMLFLAIDFYRLRGDTAADGTYTGGNHLAFIILYAFTFFFSNFGPNATTFIIPAELFPARLRSTCHGISSASGKAGAIVGAFGFLYAQQDPKVHPGYPAGIGPQKTLLILSICNVLGFGFTFLIPETKGLSLEDLSGENEDDNSIAAVGDGDSGKGQRRDDNGVPGSYV